MVSNTKILNNIKFKMSYDPSKTLNENITEQSMGGMMSPTYMSDPKNIEDFGNFIYEYRHGLIDIAAIGSLLIPVVGPAISLGLELANSSLYFSEDDPYMGGFSLAFALIPGGEMIGKIPAVKKLGRDGLAKLLKKARIQDAKFTKTELEALEQINKNKKWLKLTAAKEASKLLVQSTFKKLSLPQIVRGMYNLSLKHPTKFNLTKIGLIIGGVWYSYEKLAEIFGIKPKTTPTKPGQKQRSIVKIVSNYDKDWDYKMEGDNFYVKKKGSENWILTKGKVSDTIKTKVFGIEKTPEQIKLESEYKSNKDAIDKQAAIQLTGNLTDEEKNIEFQKVWGDFKFE
jgi:hypothetical protein